MRPFTRLRHSCRSVQVVARQACIKHISMANNNAACHFSTQNADLRSFYESPQGQRLSGLSVALDTSPAQERSSTHLKIESSITSEQTSVLATEGASIDVYTMPESTPSGAVVDVLSADEVHVRIPLQSDVNVGVVSSGTPFGANNTRIHTELVGKFEGNVNVGLHAAVMSPNDVESEISSEFDGPGHTLIADKLRGHTISLRTDAKGSVTVRDLVEASEATIASGEIDVGKLICTSAKLKSTSGAAKIRAAYANTLEIDAAGAFAEVTMDTMHGHVIIGRNRSGRGVVHVDGITGSAVADGEFESVRMHFDQLSNHSKIIATGDVAITLIPPVICKLVLSSARGIITSPGLFGLYKENAKDIPQSIDTQLLHQMKDNAHFSCGTLTVKQAAKPLSSVEFDPANPTTNDVLSTPTTAPDSGKIRTGAPVTGFYSNVSERQDKSVIPELVVFSSDGFISVNVISWYEYMKSKTDLKRSQR